MAATAVAGYYGFGNTGDELILYVLVARLKKQDPTKPIIVLSKTPEKTRAHYQVDAVQRWNLVEVFQAFGKSDTFLLGGGGLLQEFTGPWNHLYYLSLVVLAKGLGCRTELVALGVDPVKSQFNRWITRWVLNYCVDHITVRDEASRQALIDARVDLPIGVVPDPVLTFHSAPQRPLLSRIGMALRGQDARHLESLLHLLARLESEVAAKIDLLVLFPQEDEGLAETLATRSRGVSRVRIVRKPQDLLQWIGEYRLVMGSRFHALVLAASAGIPFMGWGDQPKIEHFCRERGMPFHATTQTLEVSRVLAEIGRILPINPFNPRNKIDILAAQTD